MLATAVAWVSTCVCVCVEGKGLREPWLLWGGDCMGNVFLHLNENEASPVLPAFCLSDKCLRQHSCPFGVSLSINVSGEANLEIAV